MRFALTPAQFDEAYARVRAGEAIPRVAREIGVHRHTLWRNVRRRDAGLLLGHSWEPTITHEFTLTEAAYFAGLFDGEGSLSFTRTNTWVIRIGMTHEPVIRYVGSFGGTVHANKPDLRANRQQVWTWSVARQRDVLKLLQVMRPYLIVKAQKSDEAIEDLVGRLQS